jgi:hypothetical protein
MCGFLPRIRDPVRQDGRRGQDRRDLKAEGGVNFVTVAKQEDGAITEEYIMGVK